MKKADRVSAFVGSLAGGGDPSLDPCYRGFFTCFNEQRYYEAHDVLEHLWLKNRDENHFYFKGLIQIAGAFVHLKKQFLRPLHPKDGRRLRPATRLFHLGMKNLEPFRPCHFSLDVEALHRLCGHLTDEIIATDFKINPWHPGHAPKIFLKA